MKRIILSIVLVILVSVLFSSPVQATENNIQGGYGYMEVR